MLTRAHVPHFKEAAKPNEAVLVTGPASNPYKVTAKYVRMALLYAHPFPALSYCSRMPLGGQSGAPVPVENRFKMSANLHSAPEVALQAISDLLRAQPLLSQSLYEQSCSARWQIPFEHFVNILARSAASRFKPGIPSADELENYLALLHLEDLALASACAAGNEFAWEYFIKNFRSYLHSAAAAILKRSADSPEATELADALFAELYGMDEGKPGRGSLLNYFHGRSKLSTWLRTVLAQRHIDAIRISKRWESLDEPQADGHARREPATAVGPLATPDPHRAQYLALLSAALTQAIRSLDPQERLRLTRYYLQDETLATIGRTLGEHEATVSRKLDRTRKELRSRVERLLRSGSLPANGQGSPAGLDDAQIALCFEYAFEDWPLDWAKVLDPQAPAQSLPAQVPSPLPEST
jgi:RNA polymerase sigma factor (sigma-70 family)